MGEQVKQRDLQHAPKNGRTQDTRLWRRFSQVEKLPPKRKEMVQILDVFLGSEKAIKTGQAQALKATLLHAP
jgi:hypothetical protein